MTKRCLIQVLVLGCLLFSFPPTSDAGFGKNKLHTRQLQWHIFETEHFEIHYYPEEEALAREVCVLAEAAYKHNTRLMREKPQSKTPLFIYRNQIDFQQTNILPSIIGVGTGGFTEAYKNRVALPAPDATTQLQEVIYHEFMHVLQFNLLYGEGLRSFRIYKGYLIPLWVIEGFAEYAAQDWDTTADMVVRDAVLYDYLIPLTLMDGFSHLDNVFLAYKESQLAMQYIAERYGEDKLAVIFKKFKSQISISQILRETLGMGLIEFNDEFLYWVRQKYWVQANKREAINDFATPLDAMDTIRATTATGAIWSPDGRNLAWVSNRDQTMRIYIRPRGQTNTFHPITNKKYEEFSLRGRPISWSPDSRKIAFTAREEGKDHLYILTVETQGVERRDLPVDTLYSPAWSPNGKEIALAGTKNGVSDIYVYQLETDQLRPLTQDRHADDSPSWSPDGQTLVYTSERDRFWQIIWKPLDKSDEPAVPLTTASAQHKTPLFSPDGNELFYSSDRSGIFNLYSMDLTTSETIQLTNIRSGAFQPAISPDSKKMAFMAYENGDQSVYLMPTRQRSEGRDTLDTNPDTEVLNEPQEIDFAASSIINQSAQETNLPAPDQLSLTQIETVILNSRPYQFRFSPDLLFLLAGYDSSQGVVGGGYITASDYLGDHLLSFVSDFVPGYQARTILSYANFTYPVSIQSTISYRRNYYRIIDLETSTMLDEFNDEEIGGAIGFSKPFSMFDRVETEFSLRNLKREYQKETQTRRLSSLRFGLVHDSTAWFDYAPSSGFRHNLTFVWADQLLGGEDNYFLAQINAQAYQSLDFINPNLVFSTRFMSAASLGPEHPVFLFGGIGLLPESGTIRGYRFGELMGSQYGVINFEFRFPLARNINYSLWPLDFLLMKSLQMVIYDDVGIITNNIAAASAKDIRNAIGIGFRLNTFLLGKELLTIRFEISQRTTTSADPVYIWGIGQAF